MPDGRGVVFLLNLSDSLAAQELLEKRLGEIHYDRPQNVQQVTRCMPAGRVVYRDQ
jgi:hypothetical protein